MGNDELTSMAINEVAELSTDTLDNILKGLDISEFINVFPVVKSLLAVCKVCKNYSDYRIKNRLVSFLEEVDELNQEDMREFMKTAASDEEKTGRRLIDALYDMESNKKAKLVGKVYKYCVLQKSLHLYDLDAFYRIVSCINRVYYDDLFVLKQIRQRENSQIVNDGKTVSTEIIDGLYSSGLLCNYGTDYGFEDSTVTFGSGDVFGLNKYGDAIAAVIQA